MSEASRAWRVEAGGVEREIEVDHSTWSGRIVVILDGAPVTEDRLWWTSKSFPIDLDGTPAVVKVEHAYGGFAARSTLHVAGRYVEPLRG